MNLEQFASTLTPDRERELVNQFILLTDPLALTDADTDRITAAKIRLFRQVEAARKAGSVKSRRKARAAKRNAQAAGRPKKIK